MYSRFFSVTSRLDFSSVISLANLEEALHRLILEAQWGVDGFLSAEKGIHLKKISSELRHQQLSFRPQRKIIDFDQFSKKERIFSIPSKKDKIVLTAFAQKLEQAFEPLFVQNSFGFRSIQNYHDLVQAVSNQSKVSGFARISFQKEFEKPHKKLLQSLIEENLDQPLRELFGKILEANYIDIHSLGNTLPSAKWETQSRISLLFSFAQIQPLSAKKKDSPRKKEEPYYIPTSLSCICTNIFFHPFDCFLQNLQKQFDFEFFRFGDQILICLGNTFDQALHWQKFAQEIEYFGKHKLLLSTEIRKEKKISFLGTVFSLPASRSSTVSSVSSTVSSVSLREASPSLREAIPSLVRSSMKLSEPSRLKSNPTVFSEPNKEFLEWQALEGKFAKFQKSGKIRATALREAIVLPEEEIVKKYCAIVQGLLTFYSWTSSKKTLFPLLGLYRKSCALTLADKLKLGSAQKVYKRFGPNLQIRSESDPKKIVASLHQSLLSGNTQKKKFFPKDRRINEEVLLRKPQSFSQFPSLSRFTK